VPPDTITKQTNERETIMGNYLDVMDEGTISVIVCEDCLGFGAIFWGDENSYDVEPCDCVNDEIGDY
jgi:hypothetical protein